jgi:FAD/FMN-containing dehydrogenase
MLNHTLIENLKKIAGEKNLEILSDRTCVSPENSFTISQILRLANQEKFRIIPVGAESILNAQNLLTGKELFLKSNGLNKIKKVVAEDLFVILEPGFPLKDLNEKLQSFNLFYPLADKSSRGTVGGAVACNLKGDAKDKNLQTKDYVLALEVVDPQGEILRVGARTFKSVTGYDLPRLFVGSWGTLGVITEVSLRLVPLGKRKDYEDLILKLSSRSESKSQDDYGTALSSRIKKSLDPNGVFPDLQSIVTKEQ